MVRRRAARQRRSRSPRSSWQAPKMMRRPPPSGSAPGGGDKLADELGLHSLQTALGAIAAVLHAAEGRFDQAESRVIDGDHARLNARRGNLGAGVGFGEDVGRKPVLQ